MLDKLRQAYKALTYSQGFFGASAPSSQAPNAQCSLARSPPHAAVSRTETADIHHVKGYKMLPAEPFPDPDYEQQGCSVAELAAASLSPVEGARVIPSLGKLHPRLAERDCAPGGSCPEAARLLQDSCCHHLQKDFWGQGRIPPVQEQRKAGINGSRPMLLCLGSYLEHS